MSQGQHNRLEEIFSRSGAERRAELYNAALNVCALGYPWMFEGPGGVIPGGLRDTNFVSGSSATTVDRDATAQNGAESWNPSQDVRESAPNAVSLSV